MDGRIRQRRTGVPLEIIDPAAPANECRTTFGGARALQLDPPLIRGCRASGDQFRSRRIRPCQHLKRDQARWLTGGQRGERKQVILHAIGTIRGEGERHQNVAIEAQGWKQPEPRRRKDQAVPYPPAYQHDPARIDRFDPVIGHSRNRQDGGQREEAATGHHTGIVFLNG